MHSPVSILKQCVPLKIKKIDVTGIVRITRVLVCSKAVKKLGAVPQVIGDRVKPRQVEYRRRNSALSGLQIAAVRKNNAESKADRNHRSKPFPIVSLLMIHRTDFGGSMEIGVRLNIVEKLEG